MATQIGRVRKGLTVVGNHEVNGRSLQLGGGGRRGGTKRKKKNQFHDPGNRI